MEGYMLHWQETSLKAGDCADFLVASGRRLSKCSQLLHFLERNYFHENKMPFSSDDGAAPWRELEAALRAFAVEYPTGHMELQIARITEAVGSLFSKLLDKESSFRFYISVSNSSESTIEDHKNEFRFLVEFKTAMLTYKDELETCYTAFRRAQARRDRSAQCQPRSSPVDLTRKFAWNPGGGYEPIVVTWETLEKEAPKQGRGFQPWTKVNLWAIQELEKVYGVPPKRTGADFMTVFYYFDKAAYTHEQAIVEGGGTPGRAKARAVYVLVDTVEGRRRLRKICSCRQSSTIRKTLGHFSKRL
ncbi:hypothetical protein KFL_003890050 [Klebsormidium nitens]|uniref:Uncharacterized protein n=1 Tax=Klebsormidium nitens TaxID=105231 RepID=A0A1Y1IAD7_KLENI|nr:hypothetical protein KFL_003890050 [Klebsormidium nitens]|eukprot:GAQ87934.1 hypothetical protein KFL_003890050 [Klebsormidium nitens]